MVECIHHSIHKARKQYYDDAYEWIEQFIQYKNYQDCKIPFGEMRVLAKFRTDRKWALKIMPGQVYESQFNKMEGQAFYFRLKIEFKVFFKYGVFSMD